MINGYFTAKLENLLLFLFKIFPKGQSFGIIWGKGVVYCNFICAGADFFVEF